MNKPAGDMAQPKRRRLTILVKALFGLAPVAICQRSAGPRPTGPSEAGPDALPSPAPAPARRRVPVWEGRRRLVAMWVSALGAGAVIVAGTTFALLSAQQNTSPSTVTAGTVSSSASASTVCNVGAASNPTAAALRPSDASTGWSPTAGTDPACSFQVTYSGSSSAYLGLDVLIAAKAGNLPTGVPSGTTAAGLYDGTAGGLQLQITDSKNGASVFYVKGTGYTAQGSGATANGTTLNGSVTCPAAYTGYTCYQVTDLLVSTSTFSNSNSDTFNVNYQLPSASTSGYENSSGAVVLTVHAVQAGNNTPPSAAGSTQCNAAARCATSFNWS